MPLIHVAEFGPDDMASLPKDVSARVEGLDPRLRMCVFLNLAGAEDSDVGGKAVGQQLFLDMEPDEVAEVRWYLEDYALKDSLERARAKKAKETIENWAKTLITSVNWDHLVRDSERNERLVLWITGDERRLNHVPWEALEGLWLLEHVPCRIVHVFRSSFTDTESAVSEDEPAQATNVTDGELGQGSRPNILVLSARLSLDEDIPHRLVSRLILSKIRESNSDTISLRVVRPGTWQAFKTELESKPVGHYQIVHLDVHGVEDAENRVHLGFIKAEEPRLGIFKPHLIPTADVAKLLAASGVKWVVTNACRSAKSSSADKSIALSMIKAGVAGCVAMSHNIVSRAVEIFTAALYDGLLIQGLSLAGATSFGRMALLGMPSRTSGFSDRVEVHDSIVPVVYINASVDPKHKWFNSVNVELPSETTSATELCGRESDILHIESDLLLSRRPVLLVGRAGVGKTMLLSHLAKWWKDTDLVTDSHHIQFSDGRIWNETGFYQHLHRRFLPDTPFEGPKSVISHLCDHRLLLILDSLESIKLADGQARRDLYDSLTHFLQSIAQGECLVILTSRKKENLISQHTVTHRLDGLGTIGAMQLIRSILTPRVASNIDVAPTFDVESSLHALEQIHKAVDGHPLAILTLVHDMLKRKKEPLEHLIDTLGGDTVPMVGDLAANPKEGYRCLRELAGIAKALQSQIHVDGGFVEALCLFSKQMPEALLPTFFTMFLQRFAKINYNPRKRLENVNSIIGILESSMIPAEDAATGRRILADFLKRPEPEDLSTGFGGCALDVDILFSVAGLDLETFVQLPPAHIALERVLKPIKEAGYLTKTELHRIPAHLKGNRYLSVHPLLPLVLRSSGAYQQNRMGIADVVQQAWVNFHTSRVMPFPWKYMHYNDVWTKPTELLSFEYANFLGAAFTFLRDGQENQELELVHLFILRMLGVVHKCVQEDAGRLRIIHSLWDKALKFLLAQEIRLEAVSRPQAQPAQPSSTSSNIFKLSAGVGLLSIRKSAMYFISHLILLDGRRGCPQPRDYLQIAEGLYEKLKQSMTAASDLEQLEHQIYTCRDTINPTGTPSEPWARREAILRAIIDRNGNVETYPEDQRGFEDMPFDRVSSSALVRNCLPAMFAIRRATDEGRLDEARRRIDEALRRELDRDANEEGNKAALLNLRAEINEKKGEWEDARRNREEARRLALLGRWQ